MAEIDIDILWPELRRRELKCMFCKKERTKKVIDSIVVQRVNSQPSGKVKKYEPLDARDFVDFSNYDSLTLYNVKEARENSYAAPRGSCDVLYSDRGPSCTNNDHIVGRKAILVRFMPTSSATLKSDTKRPKNHSTATGPKMCI